jgi:N-acetylmuramoyl-L-alanine amidase
MKSVILGIFFISALCAHAQEKGVHYWLGRTTGKLPFLEYGLGEDRLGGAKMTFLDSNILLKVVDSSGSNYRVQLSARHSAYIDKQSVQRISQAQAAPYYLSGSWKAYGDDQFDYVAISLDERLPYRSIQQLGPSRIAVDIFGLTSNTNWINLLKTCREIRNLYYEQTEDDVLRAVIELRHSQHWGHSIFYDSSSKKLLIRIHRQPPVTDVRNLKIAIDAGHGGENSGTSGLASGALEKNLTLVIARDLQTVLKKAGVRHILMTRTRDTTLDMPSRIMMLREFSPDLLVSIHLNSAGSDTVRGTSTYYRYIGFRPLSVAILNQLQKLGLPEFGNVGSFNFALSGPTDYPNCLVELAFLSNREDEKKILNPKFQMAAAQRILAGIRDWLRSLQ